MLKSYRNATCLIASAVGFGVAGAFVPLLFIPCGVFAFSGGYVYYKAEQHTRQMIAAAQNVAPSVPMASVIPSSPVVAPVHHSEFAITINQLGQSPVIFNQYRNNFTTDAASVLEPRPSMQDFVP